MSGRAQDTHAGQAENTSAAVGVWPCIAIPEWNGGVRECSAPL